MTPTERTMKEARKLGFTVAVVERWNPRVKIRQDLFGCIDLIAMKPGVGVIGIQACAGASHAARKAKLLAEPRMWEWLDSGARAEVWSWAKRGPRGKRKTWTLRREEIRR